MKQNKELDIFLNSLRDIASYWANIDISKGAREYLDKFDKSEIQYRCDGVVHSILCLIDGVSSANDFHMYDLKYKGKMFNDCYMHDLYYKDLKEDA